MEIKRIRFIFENCETFEISGKDIGDFLLEDIHTSYARMPNIELGIHKFVRADKFVIEIHRRANTTYKCGDDEMYKFDRILHYDGIAQIELYMDNQYQTYFLTWANEFKNENDYQSSFLSKCGHLYLCISKDGKVDDFIDSSVDDEAEMFIHFTDIGMEEI